MRWQGGRRSTNIEDRRGMGVGRPLVVGGGAAGIVIALLMMLLGGDPSSIDTTRPSDGVGVGSAIGDDTLQRRAQGRVVPESFTHGSSAQRVYWFRRGLEQGSLEACDTFNAETPGKRR